LERIRRKERKLNEKIKMKQEQERQARKKQRKKLQIDATAIDKQVNT